jgi:lincosamide nucleotidyltransferase A/C/D/E
VISRDVIDLYETLERLGVEIWIDGGWCVDALLGEQSRPHQDLDIAIQHKDVAKLRELLRGRGYKDVKLEQARDWNFVLGDEHGRETDVHSIVLEAQGNGIYGPPENGEKYSAGSLTGSGLIEGRRVRCISAEWMVRFHSGYELKDKDFQDVSAFCRRFGIDLPPEYARFRSS